MKHLKGIIALFVLSAAGVFAQSSPAFGLTQIAYPITQKPCVGSQNVGSIATVTGVAGAPQSYICQQTGAASLGQGAFAWVPLQPTVVNCGTANACSATNIAQTAKMVVGITAALNGASPAVATVTAMPAFSSTTSYVCTANVNSASASTHVLAINYVSATSVTFTAANGSTDTVSFICLGN